MADKRPVEVQVAELTQEQKNDMLKFGKRYNLTAAIALAAMLIFIILWVATFGSMAKEYKEKHDALDVQISAMSSVWDKLNAYDTLQTYSDLYINAQIIMFLGMASAGIVMIVGGIIMIKLVKRKCPCYSDKKFFYLLKQNKLEKQNAEK